MGSYLIALLTTDFVLGTKIQPNQVHLMTQVTTALTRRSRSKSNVSETKQFELYIYIYILKNSLLIAMTTSHNFNFYSSNHIG